MQVNQIIDERYQDYKYPSMLVAFPTCTFKCDKECGKHVCQNSHLAKMSSFEISDDEIVKRYIKNPITAAIICGGLEPMDSFDDVCCLINTLRVNHIEDDVVIYTGYTKDEIKDKIKVLTQWKNIVIKYGRYVPDKKPHYDRVLCVRLANDEQYAERIS